MALEKDMQAAVDNYAARIQTLKDFVTAVRKRSGMYIGSLQNAPLTMIREIFQNCIDQLMDPTSPCNWIYVYYDERTKEFIAKDNGLGFPFDDIIRILTTQHTSKNYEKVKGEYSSGMNGVGAKVVNALSESFVVESYHYSGKAVRMEFSKGYAITEKPLEIPNKEKVQGSMISFIPDPEIVGEVSMSWKSVYRLIKHIVSLTPIGSAVEFEAVDFNGNRFNETIVNKDGILTDLIMKSKHPIVKPIVISEDDGVHKLECAFCFDSGEGDGEFNDMNVTSFSNFCPTREGTHIDGTVEGITKWFMMYMNNIYLLNQKSKDKIKATANDIKTGLNIMISAAHLEPDFTGQAKEILSNPDMVPFCKEVIMRGLDNWSKSNPQDLAKLAKFFKEIAEIRQKAESSKAKIATKFHTNTLSGLPDKYAKPLGKEHLELIIVEGDSAGGQAKNGRDKYRQGVFPIRGKMPNAFQKSYKDIMSNAEVQAITHILLGRDYFRKFDPIKDVKYEKIIFMADADIDGAHINALLLRLFVLYFPQLIEAGKVYKAIPPLYSIPNGKGNTYFTEQIDITRYIQKHFSQNHSICKSGKNGSKLTSKELTVLFLVNVDYVYELERLAKNYAMNPELLEMVLLSVYNKKSISSLKKQVKSSYRFMDVVNKNGVDVVQGTIDKSYKLFITDRLIEDCSRIFDIIKKNESTCYMLDNKESSLYEVMKAYEQYTPSSLQRYKGLGEMDVEEIIESTLSPFGNRTLVRYTLEDAKEEIEAIRQYETDLSKLLALVGEVNRQDLLD